MTNAGNASANATTTLRAKYAELKQELESNPYQRPLHIESTEHSGKVRGEVYALLGHSYPDVATALAGPSSWCDILILHLNTKYCRAVSSGRGTVVSLYMGRKFNQPLEDAHRIDFAFRNIATTVDFLELTLSADQGPLSTRDYQIGVQAIPLDGKNTFLHFTYSYRYGIAGRLAMQGYLATLGRDKVGFTVAGKQSDGQPRYIGGTLGAAERNTMRYYLAIEAYLGALSAPPEARLEKRLRDWFAATEQFRRQLHEMELDEYLAMKRGEYARQQQGLPR